MSGIQERRYHKRSPFSGIKAVDKRDGAGANNWGSVKETIDEANGNRNEPEVANAENPDADTVNTEATEQITVEEEAKELTLDEWKAKKGQRVKPTFNIRKPGEGEDTSQWKKMVVLTNNKKKENESEEELEFDPALYPQRVGRQQRVLDIQFNFNDGRRGGSGFGPRGRGGPRGMRPTGVRGDAPVNSSHVANGAGEQRPPRASGPGGRGGGSGPSGEGRRPFVGDRHLGPQNAPKVNDERQFPTLS